MHNDLSKLEKIIGYSFLNKDLLRNALIHPSYANENNLKKYETNQRLEFLGDAVLELITSKYLYLYYDTLNEGDLTKIRAKIVCEDSLSQIARDLELYNYLFLGKGEDVNKVKHNNSIMCDSFEAILGAMYLDSGLNSCIEIVNKYVLTNENLEKNSSDYKSKLQEYVNSIGAKTIYNIINESGPDHAKNFEVNVVVDNNVLGVGSGKSKKEAEQMAAKCALSKIHEGNKCI